MKGRLKVVTRRSFNVSSPTETVADAKVMVEGWRDKLSKANIYGLMQMHPLPGLGTMEYELLVPEEDWEQACKIIEEAGEQS